MPLLTIIFSRFLLFIYVLPTQCILRKEQEEQRPLFLQDLANELVTDHKFPRTMMNQRMVFAANSFVVDNVHHEREKRKNATQRSSRYRPGKLITTPGSRSSNSHTPRSVVGKLRGRIASKVAHAIARNGGCVKVEANKLAAEDEEEDQLAFEFWQAYYVDPIDKEKELNNVVEVQIDQDQAAQDNKDAAKDNKDAADADADVAADVAVAADDDDKDDDRGDCDENINKSAGEKNPRMKEEGENIEDGSDKNPKDQDADVTDKAMKGDDDSDLPAKWHALSESIKDRVMNVVWARISSSSPWWPGIIYHPTGVSGDLLTLTMNCIETKYLVYFYGSNDWAHIAFNAVKPFLDHFDEFQANPSSGKKGKGKKMSDNLRKLWREGVELAKEDIGKSDKWKRATWV